MNEVKISLLSHASILIEVDSRKIVTDPWYLGTAFNDGWELCPAPDLENLKKTIQDIDVIWISHEHPDHLHFPSLKWIAENTEKEITIYFQKTNSEKVFNALKRLGYTSFCEMPHMQKIQLTEHVELACYAHRHLDSALAVFVNGHFWLLNINDTELSTADCSIIKDRFGQPFVLYNQFSIAGSNGISSSLSSCAQEVLGNMVRQHRDLNAKLTVPFASFVRFARKENCYMNTYANTIIDAQDKFEQQSLNLCVQEVGGDALIWKATDRLPVNLKEINTLGLNKFRSTLLDTTDKHDYKVVNVADVKTAIENRINDWKGATNPLIWKLLNLKPITFAIDDWDNQVWVINFSECLFHEDKDVKEPDIFISSQPLHQAFKMPFGIQTLGVSGRYRFTDKHKVVPTTWKKIRILSSLFNAEVYLSFRSLCSKRTLTWIWERRLGLLPQIMQQMTRFGKAR